MWIRIASIILFVGVMAGAFGAHALRSRLGDYEMGVWQTATLYLFIHGLAIFVIGLALETEMVNSQRAVIVQYILLAGIIIFSGSLYALALSGIKILGAITPIGGLCFLIGWLLLAVRGLK